MKHVLIFFWGFVTKMAVDFLNSAATIYGDINNAPFHLVLISIVIIMSAAVIGLIVAVGIIAETWNLFDSK